MKSLLHAQEWLLHLCWCLFFRHVTTPVELVNETSFDPGDYDLYLWIDMNDKFDTVTAPEQGTDMSHISFPLSVTIDGDTTLNLAAVGFELFPGFI
jgi:hypothetical protein